MAIALLALDALRPLLLEAKRADEDAASADDEYDEEVVHAVAGIRDASVDGEKAWLLHPKSRTEQTAVAVANLIFSYLYWPTALVVPTKANKMSKSPSRNRNRFRRLTHWQIVSL